MTETPSEPGAVLELDGPAAEVIAAVWAEALDLDEVDPDTGFFDLGASSSTVVKVVRVLRVRWPDLQLVQVFSHPTVAQLAELLDDA
ncbi:phosphopantetheine-binding protein [Streptomyces wedmorensis]|uniref:Phosphopantetheine-binding protein n=1 Tax=Streptomyces wedmorensis TaxID=43759 RepID=A0ABW6IWV0_STRWE